MSAAGSKRGPFRGALVIAAGLSAGLSLPGPSAHAQSGGPVLHEYIAPNASEDVDLSSTSASGQLPAAVRTPSGTITPPDVSTTPDPQRVYHQSAGVGASFRPDRDTRRPDIERYDDPFTPSLTPFKRMFAYDAVRDDYTVYVRDPSMQSVSVGGTAHDGDDRFFGDMSVAVNAGEKTRVPTVGPGARLLSVVTSPQAKVGFFHDSADNLYVQSDVAGRIRLVTDLAITRDVFASEFGDVAWADLPPVPTAPSIQRASFDQVRHAIGVDRSMRPRQVVTKMVAYFRSFAPSDDPPSGYGDIYLDLALSKKGVCRHRAFAFFVTALHLGLPTRLVHNEAHAWVEVRDDALWHRIDLGGAAVDLADDPQLDRPPHVPPPDQFPWPMGRDSGADLAHRNRAEAMQDAAAQGGSIDPTAPGVGPGGVGPGAPSGASRDLPATEMSLDEVDRDIFRGLPVKIRGTARSKGQPCAHLRVDVVLLVEGEAAERRLGSLSTDDRGRYAGEVVVPADIPIGDHELIVATPGNASCGTGQTR
jgi:hypothetical protein